MKMDNTGGRNIKDTVSKDALNTFRRNRVIAHTQLNEPCNKSSEMSDHEMGTNMFVLPDIDRTHIVICFFHTKGIFNQPQIMIDLTNPDAVMAYTNQAVQIRLGNFDRWEEKAKLTRDFLLSLPNARHRIEYVDFSYTAPFIRLKEQLKDADIQVNKGAQ